MKNQLLIGNKALIMFLMINIQTLMVIYTKYWLGTKYSWIYAIGCIAADVALLTLRDKS